MRRVRALLFTVLWLAWSALFLIACAPATLLPRWCLVWLYRLWAGAVARLLGSIVGLRYEVRGQAPGGVVIFAAQHRSSWDALLPALLLRDAAVVIRTELTRLPLYGWYLRRLGVIAIDRDGGPAALRRLIRGARRTAREGRPIFIFPEGTRVPEGERRALQLGVAALYAALGVAVVPVRQDSGRYHGRGWLDRRPGLIKVELLPALEPGLGPRELLAELSRRLAS